MIFKNIARMANKLNILFMDTIKKITVYDIIKGITIIIDSRIHNDLLKMSFHYNSVNMFKQLQQYYRQQYIYSVHIRDKKFIHYIDMNNSTFISKIDSLTIDNIYHYKNKCNKCNKCNTCDICIKYYSNNNCVYCSNNDNHKLNKVIYYN